jgi:hypothetical protein
VISNTVAAAPLGIGEGRAKEILVFPNPVNELLHVVLPENGAFQADLLRLDGVIVFSSTIMGPKAAIDLSQVSRGLYFLKITGYNSAVVEKIVKN